MSQEKNHPQAENKTPANLSKDHWFKLFFLLLFGFINYFLQIFSWFVALFHWVYASVTGHPNERLMRFGEQCAQFGYQIYQYLFFSEDNKPFPFSDWPSGEKKPKSTPRLPKE